MKIKVVLEPQQEHGYAVYAPSLPGRISEGDTKDEALRNMKEAIGLHLEVEKREVSIANDNDERYAQKNNS